jgi:hypothetical protein
MLSRAVGNRHHSQPRGADFRDLRRLSSRPKKPEIAGNNWARGVMIIRRFTATCSKTKTAGGLVLLVQRPDEWNLRHAQTCGHSRCLDGSGNSLLSLIEVNPPPPGQPCGF